MTKKRIFIIPTLLILLSVIIVLIITLSCTGTDKETSIDKATIYLKNEINSNTPYQTKLATDDNIKNYITLKDTTGGSGLYGFFMLKAIGNELDENEKNIILKKILPDTSLTNRSIWSYENKEENSISDADDTAFSMRALKMLKLLNTEKTSFNILDLNYFYNTEKKLFVTFNRAKDGSVTDEDNFYFHPETNANIYNLFNETKQNHNFLIDNKFIKDSQDQDGSFKNFYYPSKYYSTYMFLDFLCSYENIDKELTDIKNKGISFILNTQKLNGSWGGNFIGNPYETSLALASLKSCKVDNKQIEKGEQVLLRKQNKDGSWTQNRQIFWVFYHKNAKPKQWTSYAYVNDILLTSLAIMALK